MKINLNYFFLCFVLIIAILAGFNDKIIPDSNSTSDPIDCHQVFVVDFNSNEGLVSFQIRISNPYEYPMETIFSSFIQIQIQTHYLENLSNPFDYKNIYSMNAQNQESNEWIGKEVKFESYFTSSNGFLNSTKINSSDIRFDLLYQFFGHHTITLKCLNTELYSNAFNFDKITHFQPNTTIVVNPNSYQNICYQNNHFYAIVPQIGRFDDISIGNYLFPFSIIKSKRGFKSVSNLSYIYSNFRYKPWNQILFQVTPLLNTISNSSSDVSLFSYTKNDINVKMPKILKSRLLYDSDLRVCFENVEILSEINRFDLSLRKINKNDYFLNMLETALFKQDFSILKEISEPSQIDYHKIAISEHLGKYLSAIRSEFPNIEFFELTDDMTYIEIEENICDAYALIGTNLYELSTAVFLNKDAIVVDLQSYRCFCSDWMKKFAAKLELKYISFEEECECDNFQCADIIEWDTPLLMNSMDLLKIISQLV